MALTLNQAGLGAGCLVWLRPRPSGGRHPCTRKRHHCKVEGLAHADIENLAVILYVREVSPKKFMYALATVIIVDRHCP